VILSGKEIIRKQGTDIVIKPFNAKQVNPNSYNLKLFNELYIYTDEILDMKNQNSYDRIIIPESGFVMQPNRLYLGRTFERTFTNKYVPMLEGRSSVGRLGIYVHVTAGFGDIGFDGYWTLELSCVQPVIIYPYVEICQIYYHEISGEFDLYDNGKYNHNEGIQPSLMYKEFIVDMNDVHESVKN